jgi:small ligand-binding sensory domain FIST
MGPLPKATSVFSAVLAKVAAEGVGQTVLAALLLASRAQSMHVSCRLCLYLHTCTCCCCVQCSASAAVCAMMSTAAHGKQQPALTFHLCFPTAANCCYISDISRSCSRVCFDENC